LAPRGTKQEVSESYNTQPELVFLSLKIITHPKETSADFSRVISADMLGNTEINKT
jgi:hypothetical protein